MNFCQKMEGSAWPKICWQTGVSNDLWVETRLRVNKAGGPACDLSEAMLWC